MSGEEIDSILSGVIILLLIVVVWKWMKSRESCGQNSMTLSCVCKNGQCKCKGVIKTSIRRQSCPGGKGMEGMQDYYDPKCNLPKVGTPGYQPKIVEDNGNYSGDTVQKMALEPSVLASQKDYINGLGFSGLPTGSSQQTLLSEVGRDAFSSNFVGLNFRKFCKARALAQPAPDARQEPSYVVKEFCNIDMESLI
jgi:hypothetical protein